MEETDMSFFWFFFGLAMTITAIAFIKAGSKED